MSADYENFMERLKQLEARGEDPAKLSIYREMANAIHKAEVTGNYAHLERVVEIAEHQIAKLEEP